MNIEQKRDKLKALEQQGREIELEARKLRAEIANEICPVKVGDVIECRGKHGRIVAIGSPRHSFSPNAWGASCVRIRKDGSDGATFTISHYDTVEKIEQ
jgi:hypothetical protein